MMGIELSFSEINWLSVIVAALSAFAVGGLWYSPVLFGNIWAKEINMTENDLKKSSMFLIFGTSFFLELIATILLDMVLGKDANIVSGIKTGAIISIGWVVTSIGTNYLFSRKSFKLFLIDAGHFVVWFILAAAILGAWK
jgi:hypothetical protein